MEVFWFYVLLSVVVIGMFVWVGRGKKVERCMIEPDVECPRCTSSATKYVPQSNYVPRDAGRQVGYVYQNGENILATALLINSITDTGEVVVNEVANEYEARNECETPTDCDTSSDGDYCDSSDGDDSWSCGDD